MDIHYCSLCRIRKLPCLNPLADAPRRQDQPGRGAEEGIALAGYKKRKFFDILKTGRKKLSIFAMATLIYAINIMETDYLLDEVFGERLLTATRQIRTN